MKFRLTGEKNFRNVNSKEEIIILLATRKIKTNEIVFRKSSFQNEYNVMEDKGYIIGFSDSNQFESTQPEPDLEKIFENDPVLQYLQGSISDRMQTLTKLLDSRVINDPIRLSHIRKGEHRAAMDRYNYLYEKYFCNKVLTK